ncbi:MAG: WbqC family protein [Pseudomonadota bacterium]
MKKVAILQSNYIPWKGYFDLIASVDEFIIYDDVQYTKNDWRNRNQIKTPNGVQWITIPVSQGLDQKVSEVKATDKRWRVKHWKTIEANYRKTDHFDYTAEILHPIYEQSIDLLSEINVKFIKRISEHIGIKTKISSSDDYDVGGEQTERLVTICANAGASEYVSGPAAKDYLKEDKFNAAGIGVTWFNYDGYPEYPQLWGEFTHGVSIIDLMFNCGPDIGRYMRFVS